jgi:hypothetical protein
MRLLRFLALYLFPWEKWLFVVGCVLIGYKVDIFVMHLVTLPRLPVVIGVLCTVIALRRFPRVLKQFPFCETPPTASRRVSPPISSIVVLRRWRRLLRRRPSRLFVNHEDLSKDRYRDAQLRLDNYFVNVNDQHSLKTFAAKLDTQLKLEDFLIKFREADHAKWQVWGTIYAGAVGALIGVLLTLVGTLLTAKNTTSQSTDSFWSSPHIAIDGEQSGIHTVAEGSRRQ